MTNLGETPATKVNRGYSLFPPTVKVFNRNKRSERKLFASFLKTPANEYEKLLARI